MGFHSTPLIAWTAKGLYCQAGDFYIDPHRAVETAVITHAHSDHARRGSKKYICVASGVNLLKTRIGKTIDVTGVPYGQKFKLGGVTVSLHSAGHILGSAQVRVEYQGEVWVASGDYKRDPDPSCEPFEVVRCDTFITEATFGTPKYIWNRDSKHGMEMASWWQENAAQGFNSILFGYSLGKAQRILAELEPFAQKPIYIHPSISELTECYRREGRALARTVELVGVENFSGELILAPPSITKELWFTKIGKYKTAFASGWMAGQGGYGRGSYDHGFVLSDHADWVGLNQTIEETGATRVFVQHRNGTLIKHLRKKGLEAYPVEGLMDKNYISLSGHQLRLF